MDDNDMMLNFAPARPRPVSSSHTFTIIDKFKSTAPVASTASASADTTDEAASASSAKYLHGKAQIQSSLFTSNPNIKTQSSIASSTKNDQLPVMLLVRPTTPPTLLLL
ncbi:unnamed protein product [Absidia cylindrospora]